MIYRIFFILTIFLVSIFAENCDKTDVLTALNNLKSQIQYVQGTNSSKTLYNVMEKINSTERAFDDLSNRCPEKFKNSFKALLDIILGNVVGLADKVDSAISSVEDQVLLEEILSVVCATECESIITVSKDLPPDSSTRLIDAFINLFEKTNLENTKILTKLRMIQSIRMVREDITDEKLKQKMHRMLKAAIKADIMLQHDDIDNLYDVDENLTKEVINELISFYTDVSIKDYRDLVLFPLFIVIKCTYSRKIWIDNINNVYKSLATKNKLYTIQSLILLKEIEYLLTLDSENEILLNIISGIPQEMSHVLRGKVCVKSEEVTKPNDIIMYQSKGITTFKFTPDKNGNITLITGSVGDFNISVLLNESDDSINKLYEYYTVDKKIGYLSGISETEFCKNLNESTLRTCVPLHTVLPTSQKVPLPLGLFKLMARYMAKSILEPLPEDCSVLAKLAI